jgi:hypothetical protein
VKAIKVPDGKTVTLWLGVNVSGKVNYVIRTKDDSNKMRMWWIIQPGGRGQLGERSNAGSVEIPDLKKGSVSAKLRGKAASDTVVCVGENVSVDQSLTSHW